MENAELFAALKDRTATYGLLARIYNREVDEPLLAALHSLSFPVDTGVALLDEGSALISEYLADEGAESRTQEMQTNASLCSELAVDFTRIFIVRDKCTLDAAYPFESVYTSPEHVKMSDARDSALSFYREAGLKKSEAWKEGEDHISLLLEYMQTLAQRSVDHFLECEEGALFSSSGVSLLQKQARFLDEHLVNWVPMFATAMKANAHTYFYKGFALLTEGFLEDDRAFLGNLLEGEFGI